MTPYPLSRSERSTKVLITIFLVTMAVSIAVAELNVRDKVGWTKAGVVARYGPEKDDRAVGTPGDDAEALPSEDEPLVARMNTFTLLLDVTHPHVFELPLVIFVLAHFLMRTRVSTGLKLAAYFASFGGVALFLASPWLVRYVSLACAPLLYVGAALIGLTTYAMILIPIWDMWSPPQKRSTQPERAAGAAETNTPPIESPS